MMADAPVEPAQVSRCFLAPRVSCSSRRIAATGLPVAVAIDADGQEAALIIVGMELDNCWWPWATSTVSSMSSVTASGSPGVAGAPGVDHGVGQADDGLQVGGVLQRETVGCEPADRRRCRGCRPQASAERRVAAQARRGRCAHPRSRQAMASTRARRIEASEWVTRAGPRGSAMRAAMRSTMPIRRSASASSATPPSEVMRPPSKAALTFLRPTLGRLEQKTGGAVIHGVAGGASCVPNRVGFDNQILLRNNQLRYVRHPVFRPA